MKTKNLFLTFVIVGTIASNAHAQTQAPNAGFENWVAIGTAENPVSWSSFNNFSSYGVPEMSFKTTDFYSGTYALRLISDTATVPPPFGTNSLDTLAGFVFLGGADMSNPGISYIDRPTMMQAWVKGTIVSGGSAIILATLRKWNTITNMRDQIGQAMYSTTSSIANYTQISVPFIYNLSAIPDTLEIKIMAGDVGPGGFVMPGNEFFIDDISFTFPVGINEKSNGKGTISIFPNPASDIVTFIFDNTNNADLTLNIYNVIGALIWSEALRPNQKQINVRDLITGIYMLEIKSEDWSEKQKLIIQR